MGRALGTPVKKRWWLEHDTTEIARLSTRVGRRNKARNGEWFTFSIGYLRLWWLARWENSSVRLHGG